MNDSKNYYAVLGLKPDASGTQIESAYKKLTKEVEKEIKLCHPSRCPDDEEAKILYSCLKKSRIEINEAYQLLKNPAVRKDYEKFGYIPLEKHGYLKNENNVVEHIREAQLNVMFSPLFGMPGGLFGEPEDQTDVSDRENTRGVNCFAAVELTESELLSGAQKEVLYNRNLYCSHCGGKGCMGDESPVTCPECGGKGKTTKVKKFIVKIFDTQTCKKCDGAGRIFENICPQCKGLEKVNTPSSAVVTVSPGSIYGEIAKIELQGHEGSPGNFGDLYVQFLMPGDIWK